MTGGTKVCAGSQATGEVRPVTGQSERLHMETREQNKQLVDHPEPLPPSRPALPLPQASPPITRTAARPGCPQGAPHSRPAAAAASTGSARHPG